MTFCVRRWIFEKGDTVQEIKSMKCTSRSVHEQIHKVKANLINTITNKKYFS
jgi:hypothetical protein